MTDILDVVGLLAFAAGVTGGLWQYVGAWALCVGAVLVLAGSWYAARGDES